MYAYYKLWGQMHACYRRTILLKTQTNCIYKIYEKNTDQFFQFLFSRVKLFVSPLLLLRHIGQLIPSSPLPFNLGKNVVLLVNDVSLSAFSPFLTELRI